MKRNPISQEGQQLNKNNSCGEGCDGLTEIGSLTQNSLDLETTGDSIDNEHRLTSLMCYIGLCSLAHFVG